MNHKSFVFFDCECANTFDGVGKICSLGYVICDDDLNIIESEDVVMNPECDFDWYLFSPKNKCQLAYSKDYFRANPNFSSYYKKAATFCRNRFFIQHESRLPNWQHNSQYQQAKRENGHYQQFGSVQ